MTDPEELSSSCFRHSSSSAKVCRRSASPRILDSSIFAAARRKRGLIPSSSRALMVRGGCFGPGFDLERVGGAGEAWGAGDCAEGIGGRTEGTGGFTEGTGARGAVIGGGALKATPPGGAVWAARPRALRSVGRKDDGYAGVGLGNGGDVGTGGMDESSYASGALGVDRPGMGGAGREGIGMGGAPLGGPCLADAGCVGGMDAGFRGAGRSADAEDGYGTEGTEERDGSGGGTERVG